jgi:hypothetical protein
MAKSQKHINHRIVLSNPNKYEIYKHEVWDDELSNKEKKRIMRLAADAAKSRAFNDATIEFDSKPICEFCGKDWYNDNSDKYNLGCCEKDTAVGKKLGLACPDCGSYFLIPEDKTNWGCCDKDYERMSNIIQSNLVTDIQ